MYRRPMVQRPGPPSSAGGPRRAAPRPPAISGPGATLDLLRMLVIETPIGAVLAEPDLICDLGASRNSVRAALRRLAVEGFLDRRTRVGTTVGPVFEPQLELDVPVGSPGTLQESTVRIIPAPTLLADRLGLAAGTPLVRSESIHDDRWSRWVEVDYRPVEPTPTADVPRRLSRRMLAGCDPETSTLLGCEVTIPILWSHASDAASPLRFTRVQLGRRGELATRLVATAS